MNTKPILILLHGALGSPKQMLPLAEILADSFNVFCPAFRGHGGQAFDGNFRMEDFSEDIKLFMDSHGIIKSNIFGYSMGGYAGVLFAKNYPESVDKIMTYGTKWDWTEETAAKEAGMLIPEKMEEKIPAFVKVLQQRFDPVDWKEIVLKTASMMLALGQNPPLTQKSCWEITHEICVSVGSHDQMAAPEFSTHVSSWFPNGSYVEWEGWGHPIEKVEVSQLADKIIKELA